MTPAAEMRACEEALLHGDHSADPRQLARMLADDFIEISSRGHVSDRAAVLAWLLAKDPAARWQLDELDVVELAPGLRHVRYAARQILPTPSAGKGALHSSLWRRCADAQDWQLCFHQATKIL